MAPTSNKLVVFGATGQQGASILTTLASHPTLSQQYSLRGITRDASKPKPQSLAAQGIEIVEADLNDPSTLPRAVDGAHTVILITETQYVSDLKERETTQAKNVIDASLASGVQFFVFSTAVHASTLWTGGAVDQFDVKAEIESYIRDANFPIGSASIAPGMFMQNLTTVMKPRKNEEGAFVIAGVNDPHTKIPMIDAAGDSGSYLLPILLNPEEAKGKVIHASSGLYSYNDMAKIISLVSGERVQYVQLPGDVYRGFMHEEMGGRLVAMMSFINNPGYYGPGTEEKVGGTVEIVESVGGKLTSFEEFAERNLKSL
ncbi:NmrA/HSCARG family protein [Aspergillus stella-maris]|uniref:NmrA/HSCARG family protein n=1 Tax=Aspergillus stella-maris TaxID=1810926 RepID=UPI003CCE37C4